MSKKQEAKRVTPLSTVKNFRKLFKTESSREPGQDVYQDVFDSPCYPLQRKDELEKMIQVARTVNPRVVYEIGTSRGGGLYHWCKCLPTVERVIACDVGGVPYRDVFEEIFPRLDFLWLVKSSWAKLTVNSVAEWLAGDTIDVLFIDGDKLHHTKDFDAYLPYVSKSGIVFIHDVNERGGQHKCFRTLQKRGYYTEKIVDKTESHESMARAEQGTPAKNGYETWLRHWEGKSAGVGVVYLGEGIKL